MSKLLQQEVGQLKRELSYWLSIRPRVQITIDAFRDVLSAEPDKSTARLLKEQVKRAERMDKRIARIRTELGDAVS